MSYPHTSHRPPYHRFRRADIATSNAAGPHTASATAPHTVSAKYVSAQQ
jgi:hypothetical protein